MYNVGRDYYNEQEGRKSNPRSYKPHCTPAMQAVHVSHSYTAVERDSVPQVIRSNTET